MPLVAVLMGGASAERDISLQTGAGVQRALDSLGYRTVSLDFDERCVDELRALRPDVVFNALHGGAGEDGTVAAILEWLRLPYQGSGVRASAVAMDKWMSKALMRASDLPTPRATLLMVAGEEMPPVPKRPGLPCVVKPQCEGSAVGVTIVHSESDWTKAIAGARDLTDRILVEAYVRGREFTVSILDERPLPVIEINPSDEFYSYHSKYTAGASRHTVPANVDPALAQRMQEYALRFHQALGCRDYSRVDVMMDAQDSTLYLLECNTLPGLTSVSLFPEAAAAAGIAYDGLVDKLVRAALSRGGVRAS
jgi:D-alanine-D-alanine ligase